MTSHSKRVMWLCCQLALVVVGCSTHVAGTDRLPIPGTLEEGGGKRKRGKETEKKEKIIIAAKQLLVNFYRTHEMMPRALYEVCEVCARVSFRVCPQCMHAAALVRVPHLLGYSEHRTHAPLPPSSLPPPHAVHRADISSSERAAQPSDTAVEPLTVTASADLFKYLVLECPQGFVVGHVLSARFGHADTGQEEAGPPPGRRSVSINRCESTHAATVLHEICVDEPLCELVVTESLLGRLASGCSADQKHRHAPGAGVERVTALGEAATPRAYAFEAVVGCKPAGDFAVDGYFKQWSEVGWEDATAVVEAEQQAVRELIASAPPYPTDTFAGRGIVMVAGGKYLRDAMVTIAMLRELGCRLRIQVWHLGAAELPEGTEGFFEEYVVETYDILDHAHEVVSIQSNVGFRPFQLKPMALLYTDLEEVLLLDADSTPAADPSFLFDDPRYAAAGTLFWEDYWQTHEENPIWQLLGLDPSSGGQWEQESGQMVVNKRVAWKAVLLLQHFQADLYYSLLNGDKDTFRFAWMATNTSFEMNTHWPAAIGMPRIKEGGFCGHTMGQHDFDGNLLFIHHNQLKIAHMASNDSTIDFFKEMKQVDTSKGTFRAIGSHGLDLNVGGAEVTIPCSDIEFVRSDTDGWLRTPMATPVRLDRWSSIFFDQLDLLGGYIVKLAVADPRRNGGPAVDGGPASGPAARYGNSRLRRAGGSNATVLATVIPAESPITAHLDELNEEDDDEKIQAIADELARQYLAKLGLVGVRGRRADTSLKGTAENPVRFVASLVRTEERRSSRRRRAAAWKLKITLLNVDAASTLLAGPTPSSSAPAPAAPACTKVETFNNKTEVKAVTVSIVKKDGTTLDAAITKVSCNPTFQVETETSTTVKLKVPDSVKDYLDELDAEANTDVGAAKIQAVANSLAEQYAAKLGLPSDVKFIAKLVKVDTVRLRVRQQRNEGASKWVLVVTFVESESAAALTDVCARANKDQEGAVFTQNKDDGTKLSGPIASAQDCDSRVEVASSAPEPESTTAAPTTAPNTTDVGP